MAEPSIRVLTLNDMPAAARLQNAVYAPLYHEPAEALASRVRVAAPFCWGAFVGQDLAAYILSHPWPAGEPPAIGLELPPPPPTDNWFVHDLAISPQARGGGLARRLVGAAAAAAGRAGLVRSDLIAVQGAWSFWKRFGYRPPVATPRTLRAKVAVYGPDAVYMTAQIEFVTIFAG